MHRLPSLGAMYLAYNTQFFEGEITGFTMVYSSRLNDPDRKLIKISPSIHRQLPPEELPSTLLH